MIIAFSAACNPVSAYSRHVSERFVYLVRTDIDGLCMRSFDPIFG